MATYDCISYNGEEDLLDLRLNILDPYVDTFCIVEAELTFSGHAKQLLFNKDKFKNKKIRYYPILSYYDAPILKYMDKCCDIQETAYPFLMAFYQKESLQRCLFDAKDDDVIYYGDCDEIWTPQEVQEEPAKLEQLMYTYHLNRRSTEPWRGTAIATYAHVKEFGLNQIRQKATKTLKKGGWHFTNQGGLKELQRKLQSYDHQEVNTEEIHAKLEERFNTGEDFLGRTNITTFIDETDLPQYLKDNKERYKHLWTQDKQ